VFPDNPANVLAIHSALTRGGTMLDAAIQSVSNKKNYTKRALELTSAVKWGGLAFAALLTIASILLIANTIRLSLYARRREVEVMKLVGATDWFIRWPFVIEGVIVGAAGGILAIVVLAITKVALLDPLFSGWSLVSQIRTIAFPALVAVLLVTSAAVSAFGSGLSLRRFLRV
jgi:cell division transport system permease protein